MDGHKLGAFDQVHFVVDHSITDGAHHILIVYSGGDDGRLFIYNFTNYKLINYDLTQFIH